MFWTNVERFTADAITASDDKLREMHSWAAQKEVDAMDTRLGVRAPKARRTFRRMRNAAERQLEQRGLTW